MSKILSFITGGWQSYLFAALLSAALAGGAAWYLTSLPYKVEIADLKATQAQANAANAEATLAKFSKQADAINAAANHLAVVALGIDGAFSNLSTSFLTDAKAAPLPVDCKPDAVRVRDLSAAVAAANAAAAGRDVVSGLPANP